MWCGCWWQTSSIEYFRNYLHTAVSWVYMELYWQEDTVIQIIIICTCGEQKINKTWCCWAKTVEDRMRFYFYQPRIRIWVYSGHRRSQTGQMLIGKISLGILLVLTAPISVHWKSLPQIASEFSIADSGFLFIIVFFALS